MNVRQLIEALQDIESTHALGDTFGVRILVEDDDGHTWPLQLDELTVRRIGDQQHVQLLTRTW